jgi:hypothetical protein
MARFRERMTKRVLQGCAVLLLLSASGLKADSKNIADYKLRIHIFSRNQTTFYHNRQEEEAKGEGRANLFESGDVHGVDFNYACDEKLRASFGPPVDRAAAGLRQVEHILYLHAEYGREAVCVCAFAGQLDLGGA